MNLVSKIYLTISIANVYLFFQGLALVTISHSKKAYGSIAPENTLLQIRAQQSFIILIVILVTAFQTWLFTTIGYPNGMNVALSLVIFDLTMVLIFSGQFTIRELKLSQNGDLATRDPLAVLPILGVLITILCLVVGIALSL